MKYKILDFNLEKIMLQKQIRIDYLKITCNVCGSDWGVSVEPDKLLSNKDLTCRACLLNNAEIE